MQSQDEAEARSPTASGTASGGGVPLVIGDGNTTVDTTQTNNISPTTTTSTTTTTILNHDHDDDDDARSVESARLRESFIRLTTQAGPTVEDNDNPYEVNVPALVGSPTATSTSNNTGYVMLRNFRFPTRSRPRYTGPPSLAKAPTTPPSLTLLLPLACIITHILFAYGQWAPMWRLSLTAEDISLWANATSATSSIIYDQLGLDHHLNYRLENNHTVQTFTYGFAVHELWEAKGMPGVVLPRIAALLLVIFSGIWPHVKLVMLQHTWSSSRLSQVPKKRTRTLQWLALLGKWSLADVLAVCVMVGVLNLEWKIDPPTIKAGVVNHLEELVNLAHQVWDVGQVCSMLLPFDANDCGASSLSFKQKVECFACKKFVNAAYSDPQLVEDTGKAIVNDIQVSGHGTVRLSVVGMIGIYAFCTAVICSVLLSAVVDWYNHKYVQSVRKDVLARRHNNNGGAGEATDMSTDLSLEEDGMSPVASVTLSSDPSEPLLEHNLGDTTTSNNNNARETAYEPLEIMDDDASVFSNIVQRTTSAPAYTCLQCHHIVPLVTLAFVIMALYTPSMERKVSGAIPKLLKEILGLDFNRNYSLAMLQDMTGDAGGMDYLLMATFALFCVLGPLLRAILVVLVAMTAKSGASLSDKMQRTRSWMVSVANFLAAFCAWEVFLVAMIMVELLMPSVTNTILNTRACTVLSGDGSSCLVVSYERVHVAFACLVLGWILVGGLSLHVSMEDSKERHMENNHGEVRNSGATYRHLPTSDNEESGLPPTEVISTHAMNPFLDNNDHYQSQSPSRSAGGASMLEEQLV